MTETLSNDPLPADGVGNGWQPIETAPERTDILVCMTHDVQGEGPETIQWVDWHGGGYRWPHYRDRIDIPFPPTHWRPLPPPPSNTGQDT